MELMYSSTRNSDKKITASQAILKGLADDGGLFVPDSIPALDVSLDELAGMTYQETAYEVMKLFLSDFTEEELFPIKEIVYTDAENCGGYGPVVLRMKDGSERTIDFDGIEGKMSL